MTEPAQDPRPYVDSHVHFWDPTTLSYGWLSGLSINRPFLPADLSEASRGFNLEKIVFVQADASGDSAVAEVEWVRDLAESEPRIAAIVADAPLEKREEAEPHLDQLTQFPLVKGVRRLIQGKGLGYATQDAFVHGVQQVGARGLRFDICLFHPQMNDAIELVDRCPDVMFVLDHIGKPAIGDQILDPWAEQIGELARRENVWCKLSGMVTETDHEDWRLEDLRPYAERVLEVFGSGRVMFGSDWPVVTLAGTYGHWSEAARSLIDELSDDEQDQILYSNASHFYAL